METNKLWEIVLISVWTHSLVQQTYSGSTCTVTNPLNELNIFFNLMDYSVILCCCFVAFCFCFVCLILYMFLLVEGMFCKCWPDTKMIPNGLFQRQNRQESIWRYQSSGWKKVKLRNACWQYQFSFIIISICNTEPNPREYHGAIDHTVTFLYIISVESFIRTSFYFNH